MNKLGLMLFLALFLSSKGILVSMEALDDRSMGAVVVTIGISLLLALPSFLLKKGNILYALIINFIVTTAFYIQFVYIGYFNVPMSMYVFLQTSNTGGMAESILGRINWYDLRFFVDVIALAALYVAYKRGKLDLTSRPLKYKKAIGVVIIVFAIGLVALKPASMVAKGLEGEMLRKYTPSTFVGNYGMYGHQMLDAYQVFFQNKEIDLTDEEKKEVKTYIENMEKTEDLVEGVEEGMFEGKNLVYIQVESLHNFVLNSEVEGQEITPFLNTLKDNSLHFTNFHPQTAEGNSSDAELVALSSVYPVREGSTFFRFPENNYPSILKDLKDKGYESYAYHGDEGDFWNRDLAFPNMGFDEYYDIADYEYETGDLLGMGLSDEHFFSESAKMMQTEKEPYVSYLISLTSHYPFEMPTEEKTMELSGEQKNTTFGHYLESIHYADNTIETFFENLSEETKENSVFVIFGDHNGIFASEKRDLENWLGEEVNKEEWLTKYSTIPVMIYNPSLKAQEIERIGGQIDMRPTLSYLMGVEKEKYESTSFGMNLFEYKRNSLFLLKGDYGSTTVINDDGTIGMYTENEYDALDYSEKMIRSNFK